MSAPSPLLAGALCRCPACGRGALFEGLLTIASACPACGTSFAGEDAGDGPAVFVIFVVGALVVPLAMLMEFGLKAPQWLTIGLCSVLAAGLSLALLRPFKATLFALQWHHRAGEGRSGGSDGPGPV